MEDHVIIYSTVRSIRSALTFRKCHWNLYDGNIFNREILRQNVFAFTYLMFAIHATLSEIKSLFHKDCIWDCITFNIIWSKVRYYTALHWNTTEGWFIEILHDHYSKSLPLVCFLNWNSSWPEFSVFRAIDHARWSLTTSKLCRKEYLNLNVKVSNVVISIKRSLNRIENELSLFCD